MDLRNRQNIKKPARYLDEESASPTPATRPRPPPGPATKVGGVRRKDPSRLKPKAPTTASNVSTKLGHSNFCGADIPDSPPAPREPTDEELGIRLNKLTGKYESIVYEVAWGPEEMQRIVEESEGKLRVFLAALERRHGPRPGQPGYGPSASSTTRDRGGSLGRGLAAGELAGGRAGDSASAGVASSLEGSARDAAEEKGKEGEKEGHPFGAAGRVRSRLNIVMNADDL